MNRVLILGTFDTKGEELYFLRDRLQTAGCETLLMDVGILGETDRQVDISTSELFKQAGQSLALIRQSRDRGKAIEATANAVSSVVPKLYQAGKFQGILAIGGSAGTTIGTAAMRALPYGVPKLMVSTLASGQVQPYVGVRDIQMAYSVVDFCGLNRFSREILANAADAMAGMVMGRMAHPIKAQEEKQIVSATMFGVTTPCVQKASSILNEKGYEVLVFHATGVGGKTMEAMIRDGLIRGVLDLTTTELADQLVGGVMPGGKERLTAAALKGIPQVISLGALDMVNFGPMDTVPEKFRNRKFHVHNPTVTLMRTTPEENDQLGKEIVEKACAASGPTTILIPKKGVSALDIEDGPFWWPEADQALFESIRNWIAPMVDLIEVDMHINDPEFAKLAADTLLKRL
jgi:uncharacterized protein (UPF0261 family)